VAFAAGSRQFGLPARHPPRALGAIRRFGRQQPVAAASAVLLLLICIPVIAASIVAPYAPNEVSLAARLSGPSGQHWLGTDQFGRDVLSRLLFGGRTSLAAGIGATALGVSVGVLLGLIGGYAGGFADMAIQRLMDAIMALPPIILLMVLASMLSPSIWNLIFGIAIFVAPGSSRIVRGAVVGVKEMAFVEAARSVGASPLRLVLRHILPNVVAPIIVIASISVGSVILAEAALGFLGLSVRQPTATWGNMLNTGAQSYMEKAPWLAIAPGIAIGLTVFSINLLGDGLRDALDPRLRGRSRMS
jgi:peptide/nickel transport system permease protein